MSAEAVLAAARNAAFRPSGKAWLLPARHVPLDDLIPSHKGFEGRAVERLTAEDSETVVVIGPSGSGKSSFITWVADRLPDSHTAIWLPVSALADVTDTGEVLKLSLSTILAVIKLDATATAEAQEARADRRTTAWAPTGITGGRIGGGAIPAQVQVEVGSLRQEFHEEKLNGEYLAGVIRVVQILRHFGRVPVVVFEDTEAIVGGPDEATRARGFFDGPMHAFAQGIDAPCLIAVQTHLTEGNASYDRLAASAEIVEIPLMHNEARDAIRAILARHLLVAKLPYALEEVMADDALDGLVQFYDETAGNLRKTLSAAHGATDEAAAISAERVRASHVRIGVANSR